MTSWEKSGYGHSRRRERHAGFTLIELMIVVAILGILAAVAIPSVVSYIYKAKTIEATTFLSEIRVRQESYRSDFDQYASVSTSQTDWYPQLGTGQPASWTTVPAGWLQLGATPPGRQSIFGYSVLAGAPGGALGLAGERGFNDSDYWFIASAASDLDGDGTTVTFELYSASKSVYCSQDKGWE